MAGNELFKLQSNTLSSREASVLTATVLGFSRGWDGYIFAYSELFRRKSGHPSLKMSVDESVVLPIAAEVNKRIAAGIHIVPQLEIINTAEDNARDVRIGIEGRKEYIEATDDALYAGIAAACIDRDAHFLIDYKPEEGFAFNMNDSSKTKTRDFLLSSTPRQTAVPQLNDGIRDVATYLQTVSYKQFKADIEAVPFITDNLLERSSGLRNEERADFVISLLRSVIEAMPDKGKIIIPNLLK